MLVIGFPSNPTRCAWNWILRARDRLAKAHDILVVHDLAYADITFDGWKAPSIMQVAGARDIAWNSSHVEELQHGGLRIGFMVGNKASSTPSRASRAITTTHLHADPGGLDRGARRPAGLRRGASHEYEKRRDVMVRGCTRRAGWWRIESLDVPLGEDPWGLRQARLARIRQKILKDAKVAVSPGIGFGDYGDDHVRIALIENEARTRQAIRGIKDMFRKDGLLKS